MRDPIATWNTPSGVIRSFSSEVFSDTEEFLTESQFIYGGIYALNMGVYIIYAIIAALCFFLALKAGYQRTGLKEWIVKIGNLKPYEALVVISIIPLLVLTALLAARDYRLIETGLTYLILVLSCATALFLVRYLHANNRLPIISFICIFLFLTMTFPLLAFSIDAYSNLPRSEANGLQFIAENSELDGKAVSCSSLYQIMVYTEEPIAQIQSPRMNYGNLQKIEDQVIDMVVLRNTWYYYRAMRYDMSFKSNLYHKYLWEAEDAGFDRIYASPTFIIYTTDLTHNYN